MHETRSSTGEYEHEMTPQDHANLLVVLGGKAIGVTIDATGFKDVAPEPWWEAAGPIAGKFLLSGYKHPMYQILVDETGILPHEFEIDNKASGVKSKQKKVEIVWTNF